MLRMNLNKLGMLRLAAVSPMLKISDTEFNATEIITCISGCNDKGVEIVVFPELSITAYTCGDLFFQSTLLFAAEQALLKICDCTKELKIIAIIGLPLIVGSKLFNCAAVIQQGKILGIVPKTYLCNYSEYYEKRWFVSEFERITDFVKIDGKLIPFGADLLFSANSNNKLKFGVEICEDMWAVKSPGLDLALNGASLIFNLSASNEYLGKYQYRRELIKNYSSKIYAAYIYSSSSPLESTSDTVFSGNLIIAENGKILQESKRFSFETQLIINDIDFEHLINERIRSNTFAVCFTDKSFREIEFELPEVEINELLRVISKTPFIPENMEERDFVCNEISDIQATALARRFMHTKSDTAVIGISGGLDSSLALLSTIKCFQKLNKRLDSIIAVNMPGFGSTTKTKNNAIKLAELYGVSLRIVDIKDSVNQHFNDIGHPSDKFDITYENAQARMRTLILMDIANQSNGIVVGTGDLSEIALGWNTYNGDHMSMYGLNSGIPKTLIKYIVAWYADHESRVEIAKILKDIIKTPISPELLPIDESGVNLQDTEKSIGPYILNDFFLYYFVRCSFSSGKILKLAELAFKDNFKVEEIKMWLILFYKRFMSQQFKRNSMPDGIKIGSVSLSPRSDWRMPSETDISLWIKELNG